MKNPHDPFNPFIWIYKLSRAGVLTIYDITGLRWLVQRYQLQKLFTPGIPYVVVTIVLFLLLILYAGSLRIMLQEQWCPSAANSTATANNAIILCLPVLLLYDVAALYFGGTILFFYFKTNVTSPGVALPSLPATTKTTTTIQPWSCMEGQGGFFASQGYPKCHEKEERQRVLLYGKPKPPAVTTASGANEKAEITNHHISTTKENNEQQQYQRTTIPDPFWSYCSACNIMRPPRCHHCKVCQRCILQFDHHCYWLNTCIGYNNYHCFLALLVHIVLACWYSLFVLILPFYELVRQEQEQLKTQLHEINDAATWWKQMVHYYQESQFFADVPKNPWELWHLIRMTNANDNSSSGGFLLLPWDISIRMAYPFALGIGTVMTIFLGFHIRYVLQARTTLEHKIILDLVTKSLWKQAFGHPTIGGRQ